MAFHFDVSRESLLKAISAQQNITNKKGTIAILSYILLDVKQNSIILTGTDLEIGLKQEIEANVIEQGTISLPAKKLYELVRESSSLTISFQEKENYWIEITADSSFYKLAGMSSSDYPSFPEYNNDFMIEVEATIFNDLIDKTIFSISQDKENMYSLTAVLFQKEIIGDDLFLKFISSDGHRLTIMNKKTNCDLNKLELNPITLIPRKGVQEIRKFCENCEIVKVGIEKKQAVFKNKNSLLIIRLMEGEFPDYQTILDLISRENTIEINRIRFLESLKRINLFTEDMFHAIKMDISENCLTLMSQNADYGSAKDEFEVVYKGEKLTLGFNCRYFIDTLQVMEGSTITASINSNESPCLITSENDPGFLSIIMPMKI
jgi:DNA polymerase-3 subunit beta